MKKRIFALAVVATFLLLYPGIALASDKNDVQHITDTIVGTSLGMIAYPINIIMPGAGTAVSVGIATSINSQ